MKDDLLSKDVEWKFNDAHMARLVAMSYRGGFEALYEFTKNLEEEKATQIDIEFLDEQKIILVYGNGTGMSIDDLNEVMFSVGQSHKSAANHGVGILAFLRLNAEKMTIYSRLNGCINVLTCVPNQKGKLVSKNGSARAVNADDQDHRHFYKKLNQWDQGTMTVLEGVGKNKSSHDDINYNMKEEGKKFVKELKARYTSSLQSCKYRVRINETAHLEDVKPQKGKGIRYKFSVPSKNHPATDISVKGLIKGSPKNTFSRNGKNYELWVDFDFYVSLTNAEGKIQISQDKKDSLNLYDIRSTKIPNFYHNSEYTQYLTGYIDFSITGPNKAPLADTDKINVYTMARDSILLNDQFGDCFSNILFYAEQNILREAVTAKKEKLDTHQNKLDKDCKKHFEIWQRDSVIIQLCKKLDNISGIETFSSGPVVHNSLIVCPRCSTASVPRRGETFRIFRALPKSPVIYAPSDNTIYLCGSCGNTWPGARHSSSSPHGTLSTPIYTQPPQDKSVPRERKHAKGYTVGVVGFGKLDSRVAKMVGEDTVQINSEHPGYIAIEASKNASEYQRDHYKDALVMWEGINGFTTIINHKFSQAEETIDRSVMEKREQEYRAMRDTVTNFIMTWIQTTPRSKRKGIELPDDGDENGGNAKLATPAFQMHGSSQSIPENTADKASANKAAFDRALLQLKSKYQS